MPKHHTEETKAKIRASNRKAWQNPELRAHNSAIRKARWEDPEYRDHMSVSHKRLWQNPEYAQMIFRAQDKKPNKAELKLQEILDRRSPGEWKFVGDGQVNLGGRIPDFININGQKEVIELFGAHWHPIFDLAERKEHYKQYGFRVAIIWEDELEDEDRLVKAFRRKFGQ